MRRNERYDVTVSRIPVQEGAKSSDLHVVVLYRTPEQTKEALRYATKFADGLTVNLKLVDVEVVPYPCPLDRPMIDPDFARRRLETVAQESGLPVEAELVYARDREDALTRLLDSVSVVLIPVSGFWQRMRERSLTRKLIKHGHDVILVPCK